jgi:16S rRNA (cytosine1402-N4)-methyltransferase
MIEQAYHVPVMLNECIEGLEINPEGTYVDVTFGGGGHSKAILEKLTTGKLFGFDQDQDAKANALKINNNAFTLIAANFRYLKKYLRLHGIEKVDGVLADLGISSHQINTPERGFSTRFDAELDMRMNQMGSINAKNIINEYSEHDLHKIFGMYGEIKNAKSLAQQVVRARASTPISTVFELKDAVKTLVKKGEENKYYAQMFQALRIEVNDELKTLEEMLMGTAEVIRSGGLLVVMSYHSLEDRLVKNFIQKGKFHGEVEKDFYGNEIKPFEAVNRKLIEASEAEVAMNNRARSAKLRIARKL